MIYIDNGKTVIEYHTRPKTEKAVQALLDAIADLFSSETIDGMKVAIVERGGEQG